MQRRMRLRGESPETQGGKEENDGWDAVDYPEEDSCLGETEKVGNPTHLQYVTNGVCNQGRALDQTVVPAEGA